MAKSMNSINLLPNKADTMLIQFLNWALTVGRLLIIIVETLALGTFLYRFTLDWQISDLKDKVKNQRAIISNFKPQEEMYRNLQARLEQIKKLGIESEFNPRMLSDILEAGRGYVTFRNLNLSGSIIRIEAAAPSAGQLNAFVDNIKLHPQIKSISIDRVENKTSRAEISVGISANLKERQKVSLDDEKSKQKQFDNESLTIK